MGDSVSLDGKIVEVCEKLNQLSKRERDIKINVRTDVDIVGKKIIFLEESESKDVI